MDSEHPQPPRPLPSPPPRVGHTARSGWAVALRGVRYLALFLTPPGGTAHVGTASEKAGGRGPEGLSPGGGVLMGMMGHMGHIQQATCTMQSTVHITALAVALLMAYLARDSRFNRCGPGCGGPGSTAACGGGRSTRRLCVQPVRRKVVSAIASTQSAGIFLLITRNQKRQEGWVPLGGLPLHSPRCPLPPLCRSSRRCCATGAVATRGGTAARATTAVRG